MIPDNNQLSETFRASYGSLEKEFGIIEEGQNAWGIKHSIRADLVTRNSEPLLLLTCKAHPHGHVQLGGCAVPSTTWTKLREILHPNENELLKVIAHEQTLTKGGSAWSLMRQLGVRVFSLFLFKPIKNFGVIFTSDWTANDGWNWKHEVALSLGSRKGNVYLFVKISNLHRGHKWSYLSLSAEGRSALRRILEELINHTM